MFGIEGGIAQLGLVIALCGLIPTGMALAAEERREAAGQAGSVAGEARREAGQGLAAAAAVDAAAAIAAVGRAGYAGVTELEWERGGWELKARDAAGRPVRLWVDGWTGQVGPR